MLRAIAETGVHGRTRTAVLERPVSRRSPPRPAARTSSSSARRARPCSARRSPAARPTAGPWRLTGPPPASVPRPTARPDRFPVPARAPTVGPCPRPTPLAARTAAGAVAGATPERPRADGRPRAAASGGRARRRCTTSCGRRSGTSDAEYGALGVLTPDGSRLDRFVIVGMGDEDARPHRPAADRATASSVCWWPSRSRCASTTWAGTRRHRLPAGAPADALLPRGPGPRRRGGVRQPVPHREARGGPFTPADTEVAQALAAVAGLAIENARLAERAETRRRWGQAATEMATALLSGADPDDVLRAVSTQVSDAHRRRHGRRAARPASTTTDA